MLYFHKLLPLLLSPLVVLIVIALFSIYFNRKKTASAALLLLWIMSLPVFSDWLWLNLENNAVLIAAENVPQSDAIVVLSGMARDVRSEDGYKKEWGEASDRFWAGLELYQAERAPKLVLTGGRMPWSINRQTEGEWLRSKALLQGIPDSAIFVSKDVNNTAEEAQALALSFPKAKILLVTSAFHMPRAQLLFQKQGFDVTPFPVDILTSQKKITPMDFIPSTGALWFTFRAYREWLGRAFYAIKN